MKQPATDNISQIIAEAQYKISNGKAIIKAKRHPQNSIGHKPVRRIKKTIKNGKIKLVRELVDKKDGINKIKRDIINIKVRNDINPADGAHSVIADTKKKISDEIRDLEGFN